MFAGHTLSGKKINKINVYISQILFSFVVEIVAGSLPNDMSFSLLQRYKAYAMHKDNYNFFVLYDSTTPTYALRCDTMWGRGNGNPVWSHDTGMEPDIRPMPWGFILAVFFFFCCRKMTTGVFQTLTHDKPVV